MKKIFVLAIAIFAFAAITPAEAAKKKKNKKQDKVEAVQLANSSDTLSYAAGMALTNGLLPYLIQSLNVDTAYMADFVRGFNEIVNRMWFKGYLYAVRILFRHSKHEIRKNQETGIINYISWKNRMMGCPYNSFQ